MISPEPHNVYLAMIVDEAKQLSTDGLPASDLLYSVQGLTQEHFPDANSRWLFATISTLLQSGVVPRGGAVMASATKEQKQYVEDILVLVGPDSTVETGSFSVARKALVEAAVQRNIFKRVEAAKSHLKEGRVMDADEALRAPSDLQGALLTPLRQDTYESDSLEEGAEKFIASPWKAFNDALGGGYGVGGTFAVTAVIGQSGMGKSHWARQQVPFFAESGHRVLYCAGEADQDEVLRDIYTLTAGVTKATLRNRVPIAVDHYRKAYHYLQQFPKAIQIVAERRFTPEQILELATVAKAELDIDKREGRAKPNAQLMVIVDNLDHAIPKIQRMSEWEVIDETLGHFAGTASQSDFGMMLLAQPSSEGAGKFGPNRLYEIQGGKRASNHLATVLSLWRPTTEEHRKAELKDGSPHPYRLPCIAKLKCRAEGSLDDLPFDTNPAGLWYPRGERPTRREFGGNVVEVRHSHQPDKLPW